MNHLPRQRELQQKTVGLLKLGLQYLQQPSVIVLPNHQESNPEPYNLHLLTGLLSHPSIPAAATLGADHIIHFANLKFAQLCDRPMQELIGKSLREVLPEIVAEIGTAPYAQVYFNGALVMANAISISVSPDALEFDFHDFRVQPHPNREEDSFGLLIYGVDVSDQMRRTQYIEQLESENEQLQLINEELKATAEELQFQCEEMDAVSEELRQANEEIRTMNEELQQYSDRQFHQDRNDPL